MSEIGSNVGAPLVRVNHASLERTDPDLSVFRSNCPKCDHGMLLMRRNRETFAIQRDDRCTLCGQAFRYTDCTPPGGGTWDSNEHRLKREIDGSGETSSITPVCSCGWRGTPVYAWQDAQYLLVGDQEGEHVRVGKPDL